MMSNSNESVQIPTQEIVTFENALLRLSNSPYQVTDMLVYATMESPLGLPAKAIRDLPALASNSRFPIFFTIRNETRFWEIKAVLSLGENSRVTLDDLTLIAFQDETSLSEDEAGELLSEKAMWDIAATLPRILEMVLESAKKASSADDSALPDISALSKEEVTRLAHSAKGMWKDRADITDTVEWVRSLREGLHRPGS